MFDKVFLSFELFRFGEWQANDRVEVTVVNKTFFLENFDMDGGGVVQSKQLKAINVVMGKKGRKKQYPGSLRTTTTAPVPVQIYTVIVRIRGEKLDLLENGQRGLSIRIRAKPGRRRYRKFVKQIGINNIKVEIQRLCGHWKIPANRNSTMSGGLNQEDFELETESTLTENVTAGLLEHFDDSSRSGHCMHKKGVRAYINLVSHPTWQNANPRCDGAGAIF